MRTQAISTWCAVALVGMVAACGGSRQKQQAQALPEEPKDKAALAQPAAPQPEKYPPAQVALGSIQPGGVILARLDEALGARESEAGDRFTATVSPDLGLPAGARVVGRVLDVRAPQAGAVGWISIMIEGIEVNGQLHAIHGRVVGAELTEPNAERPVRPTGPGDASEVIGGVIDPEKLKEPSPRPDMSKGGTILSLGTGRDLPQIPSGTPLAVLLEEPIRIADLEAPTTTTPGAAPTTTEEMQPVAGHAGMKSYTGLVTTDVIDDRLFWVRTDDGQETLVELARPLDQPESKIVVKKGDRVSFEAEERTMPPIAEAKKQWTWVDEKEAKKLAAHKTYLFATRAKVLK